MSHEIVFGTSFCYTPIFTINGKDAESDDFGRQGDNAPEDAEPYGCGDMTFSPRAPTDEVLQKYGIDELEYWTIANSLAEGLSFGSCGWCI